MGLSSGNLFGRILSRVRGEDTTAPRVDSAAFRRYAEYYAEQTNALADEVAAGRITVQEWLTSMRREVEGLHVTAQAIGVGGLEQLTSDDLRDIAARLDAQYGYLDQWAAQLEAADTISADALKSRSALYLNAANATVQQATTTALGMPTLPAYPGDGSTKCLTNCQCRWRFRRVSGGWDCTWTLGSAEHCDTCIARAGAWNPLRIRDGAIENPGGGGLFFRR